ncbi:MAG: hypothetical protein ACXVB1_11815 [Pseudobdellovibrionaceae bacterium]
MRSQTSACFAEFAIGKKHKDGGLAEFKDPEFYQGPVRQLISWIPPWNFDSSSNQS